MKQAQEQQTLLQQQQTDTNSTDRQDIEADRAKQEAERAEQQRQLAELQQRLYQAEVAKAEVREYTHSFALSFIHTRRSSPSHTRSHIYILIHP